MKFKNQLLALALIVLIPILLLSYNSHRIHKAAAAAKQAEMFKDKKLKEYLKKQAQRLQLPDDWPEPFTPPSPDVHRYDQPQNYPDGLDHA